jgi:hypothetical protein
MPSVSLGSIGEAAGVAEPPPLVAGAFELPPVLAGGDAAGEGAGVGTGAGAGAGAGAGRGGRGGTGAGAVGGGGAGAGSGAGGVVWQALINSMTTNEALASGLERIQSFIVFFSLLWPSVMQRLGRA